MREFAPSPAPRIGRKVRGVRLGIAAIARSEIDGLDLATTDLVNARSLLEKNPKALKLIETCPADRPLAVQLFGSVPEEMRHTAV